MSDDYIDGIYNSSPCKYRSPYVPPCTECPPVRIEITVLPDKIDYENGESIDLTGIVVRAFKANGNLWGGFPHGIIPIEQLTYDPTTISPFPSLNTVSITGYNKSGGIYYKQCYWNNTLNLAPTSSNVPCTIEYFGATKPWTGTVYFTGYNGRLYIYLHDCVMTGSGDRWWVDVNDAGSGSGQYGGVENLYWIWSSNENYAHNHWVNDNSLVAPTVPTSDIDPTTTSMAETNTITVSWTYEGETFTDTFDINVD